MRPFAYARADDVADAVRRAASGATYLGGGTNLVDLMKLGVLQPDSLVDVSRLPLTDVTSTDGGGLAVGAAVRNSDLAAHPLVLQRYPALSQALLAGASGQLRNLATVGGNLLQRTRCPYFQDVTTPCNKRSPGSGCPAREGEHHNLAVLGTSPTCIATHPSDMAVALMALEAVVRVEDVHGGHEVPLDELWADPAGDPAAETTLRPEALVVGVDLPGPLSVRSGYRKVRERASYAFALGSVAAVLDLDGDTVRDVRLALGAVSWKPWRARRAEAALRGRPATRAEVAGALDAELTQADPLPGNAFKVPLVRAAAVELLAGLAGRDLGSAA